MNKTLALAGLAATLAFQSTAFAQQARSNAMPAAAQPSWYIGGGIGNAKIPEAFDSGSVDDGRAAASSGLQHKRSHTLAKAFVGLKVNRYLSLEAGYMDLGRFGGERTYSGPDGSLSLLWTVRGFNFDIVGTLPVTESLGLHARIGTAVLTSDGVARSNGVQIATDDSRKWALHYGVGLQYEINRTFAIRGDYELFKKATNSNFVSWSDGREFQYQAVSASGIVKF